MTGNTKVWRAPLAGLASVAMIATMGVAALSANAVTFEPDTDANGNAWYYGDPVYTVTYDLNGRGEWTDAAYKKDASYELKQDTKYAYADNAKGKFTTPDGFVFEGWWTSPTIGQGEQIKVGATLTKDVTLYAHWAKTGDVKTVTFDNTDGRWNEKTYSVTVATGDKLSSWQLPTDKDDDQWLATGYAVAYGTSEKAYDVTAPVTEDVTVAPTGSKAHLVQFVGAENYDFVNGSDWQYDVADGAAVPSPFTVSKSGSAATGWDTITKWDYKDASSGETVDVSGGVKTDVKAYPVANKTAKAYKIVFKVNDLGENGEAPQNYAFYDNDKPTVRYVLQGEAISLPSLNTYDGLYKVGSWKYASVNTGTWLTYAEGQKVDTVFSNKTDNPYETTLHATTVLAEEPSAESTITFDPNYTGSKPSTVKVSKGDVITAPVDPTLDGYTFLGWNTNKGANADTEDGWLTPSTKADGTNVTYYAIWKLTNRYELDELLELTGDLYTTNSFAKYEAVRAQLAKDSEGRIKTTVKNGVTKYEAVYDEPTLTADLIDSYIDTLNKAKAELEFKADLLTRFSDVDINTPHAYYIWTLADKGVIKGYADGTFSGLTGMTRADFAAYLYRLAGEPDYTVDASDNIFTDVDATTPHYKEILWAAKNGILKGYADGTFGWSALVNRQDAAAFLYRLAGSPRFDTNKVASFVDVDSSTPHYKEILWAAKNGVVKGYAGNFFSGSSTIARQDAAAFLGRALKYGLVAKW